VGSDQYRNELVGLQKELALLQSDLGKLEDTAQKARAEAARKRSAAAGTKSLSTMQMNLRAAENEEKKVVAAEQKIAGIRTKLASNADRQRRAQTSLASSLKTEQAAAVRAEEARKRKEKTERDARDREDARRRQTEKTDARDMQRLASVTVRHVLEREPEPEKLRILYLTSSPGVGAPLRVDTEVNIVLKELRSARHRDVIEVHHRPAATPDDLRNGINDLRPHVIHFSGHGGPDGLEFDSGSLEEPGIRLLSFVTLANLLKATDLAPTLLVLNACNTTGGAEPLLEAVPVLIAMADEIDDVTAALFARHLYAAVGGGQSIGHSLSQAQAMLENELPDESNLLELRAAPGVDVDSLILVQGLQR
jgi:CHAT domain